MSDKVPDKGDILFFREAKWGSRAKGKINFLGHAFGIFLGHVPLFVPDPTEAVLMRIIGSAGFISFDDLGEFLGEEVQKKVLEKFLEKYPLGVTVGGGKKPDGAGTEDRPN